MAYVYRHIRLDKNTPFYVGIGKDKYFRRAYATNNRNKHWNNVTSKTEYEVEILFYNVDYEFAKLKEKEFIKLYGRRDLGLGELVNLTDGGEGNTNWSPQQIEKFRLSRVGRKASDETRRKLSESHKGYKPTEQTLEKMRAAGKRNIITKETREKMASRLRGRPLSEKMKKMLIDLSTGRPSTWSYQPISQFNLNGDKIKEYPSITHAAKELNLQNSNIYKVLVGKRNHCGGFKFKYTKTT